MCWEVPGGIPIGIYWKWGLFWAGYGSIESAKKFQDARNIDNVKILDIKIFWIPKFQTY